LESPDEVEKVAYAIGTVLRATRKVKRGLGSIRQDLNVSIPEGALIEIKGVQELEIIGKAVELEVNRQQNLLAIRKELLSRNLKPDQIERKYVNLSELFLNSEARVIKAAMSKGGVVLAVKLPKFNGLVGRELSPGLRLGTELSNRASFWAGVGGIFHSDELPAYGISEAQVIAIRERLGLTVEDAFVLVADDNAKARDALDAVVDRANEALVGVPEETRTAMPDGTTRYMRPRPGAARMYPETDVPETSIPEEYLSTLRAHLPETPEKLAKRFMDQFSLNQTLAKQLVDSDYLSLFERVVVNGKTQPSFVATFLTGSCKSLEREGIPVHTVPDVKIEAMFQLVDKGAFAKEALPDLLKWQVSNPSSDPSEGIQHLGLRMLSQTELEQVIDRHIEKNKKLVETKGQGAFPSIMGSIMSEVRGRTDPKLVTETLKKRLSSAP
jgi:glutamyl-tRNA(Gln) amidotransferase subunit E